MTSGTSDARLQPRGICSHRSLACQKVRVGRWVVLAAIARCVFGQDQVAVSGADGAEPATRAAQIEAAREAKAAALAPDEPKGIEREFDILEDKQIVQRLTAGVAGFRIHIGESAA